MTSSSWAIVLGFLTVCAAAFAYDASQGHDAAAASTVPPTAAVNATVAGR